MKEREISLIDLTFEILLHWRGIIVFMVIGGICFGGLGYVKSYQSTQVQIAQQMEINAQREQLAEDEESLFMADKKRLEESLTEKQIYNVNAVLGYERLYQDRANYLEQSVLMQVDPNNIFKAQLVFLVRSDILDNTYNLEKIYENLVCSGELYDYLALEYGVDSAVISELVMLERGSSEAVMLGASERVIVGGTDTDSLRVAVVHYDEEQCEAMAQSVVAYVTAQAQKLKQELGEHEVIAISQSMTTVTDTNIMDKQKKYLEEMIKEQETAAKLKDDFTDKEKQYYNFLVKGKNSEELSSEKDMTVTNTYFAPRINVKYVLVGMVLAAFAYAFVIFLCYILNSRLRATDSFQEICNMPQMGHIPGQKKRRFLDFIDAWLLSFRNRNKRVFTLEEAIKLAVAAIRIAAKKDSLDTVYLVGCDMKKGTLPICEQIQTFLEKEDIVINILDNILYNAETMEKLNNVQGVVLVEKAGSTLYEEIYREVELLKRQNIKVLGGIIVE